MNYEIIATVLGSIVTGAIGFIFFYFPWQAFVVDQTRQRLFEIRDSWFDYSLTLDDPADKVAAAAVRQELNYLIRLVHHITIPVLIAMTISRVFHHEENSNSLVALLSGFKSDKAAKEAQRKMASAFAHISWCMIRRSLIALVVLVPAVIVVAFTSATSNGLSALTGYVGRLTEAAADQAHQQGRYA